MTDAARHFVPALKALVREDRAELAHVLIASLEEQADEGADAAWDAELARRKADILSGKAEGIPAAQVFETLAAKYS